MLPRLAWEIDTLQYGPSRFTTAKVWHQDQQKRTIIFYSTFGVVHHFLSSRYSTIACQERVVPKRLLCVFLYATRLKAAHSFQDCLLFFSAHDNVLAVFRPYMIVNFSVFSNIAYFARNPLKRHSMFEAAVTRLVRACHARLIRA